MASGLKHLRIDVFNLFKGRTEAEVVEAFNDYLLSRHKAGRDPECPAHSDRRFWNVRNREEELRND